MPEHIRDGRIVVDEVVKLWAKHGVQPDTRYYLRQVNGPCGCLLGILYVEAFGGVDAAFEVKGQGGFDWVTSLFRVLSEKTGLEERYIHSLDTQFTALNVGDGAAVRHQLRFAIDPEYSGEALDA